MTNEQEKYIRYSENVEVKQENEDEDVQKIRESFARGRMAAYEKHRHVVRDAHAKSHGILKGKLSIYENLLEELKQGLFSAQSAFPAARSIRTLRLPKPVLRLSANKFLRV